jgi:hypothetical protein
MEVTSLNFDKVLPDIERAIEEASFLSVDLEFSGTKPCPSFQLDSVQRASRSKLHYDS